MNLQSKKARIPIAALGVTALCTAGLGVAAGSAYAVGETLSFIGATNNSASMVAGAMNTVLAPIAYGVRINGLASNTRPLKMEVLTGPSGGLLASETQEAGAAPVTGAFTTITPTVQSTAGSKSITFSAATTTATTVPSVGEVLRYGTAPAVQYAVVTARPSSTTATLSVASITTASGQPAANAPDPSTGSPTTNPAFITTPVQPSTPSALYTQALPTLDAGDNLYFGAAVAGTYTFRIFADTVDDGVYQANTDDSTPTFTLTVKSPADAFTFSAPSTVTAGTTGAQAKITPSVDTTDIRGGSPSALGTALAGALTVDVADNGTASSATTNATTSTSSPTISLAAAPSPVWAVGAIVLNANNQTIGTVSSGGSTTTVTLAANAAVAVGNGDVLHVGSGVAGENTGGLATNSATDGIYRYLSGSGGSTALTLGSGTPTSLTTQTRFNGTLIAGSAKTTDIVSNGVSTVTLAAKSGQTANVSVSGSAAKIRTGTADVTYTALAKDNSSPALPLSGKDVTFTLAAGSGTALTDLKANGAAVPSNGQVTVTTNDDGVAVLKVTSTKTANGNAYSVTATSGTATVTPSTINAAYETSAAATVTAGSVAALVGGSATLTGKVVDQFGEPFSGNGLTAALSVTGSATPASGNYAIGADGKFSATVNDTASNTAARNDTFVFTVGAYNSGTKTLSWRTSITAGSVGITTTTVVGSSSDTTIPFTSTATKVDLASSAAFSGDLETVKGTVYDTATTPAALPFAEVVYSGSDGVYFYDADNKLSKTITARTTSTGKLSYDGTTDGIRVLFTKAGDATLTAKVGSIVKAVTLPVEISTDPFKVTSVDVKGKPDSSVTLQGKVLDAFGNPASGRKVTLALSNISAGSLSGNDADTGSAGFQVLTDDTGVWSTPFASTSNQTGKVTVTATLWNAANSAVMTANPTANAAYSTAGVTVDNGVYQTTSTVEVAETFTEIAVTSSLLGGGKAQITGTAEAGAAVDLYSRPSGASGFELVKTLNAASDGTWGIGTTLVKTTSFFARSNGKTSSTVTTVVYSTLSVKAKALGKGKVRFTVLGTPNVKGVANIYYGSKRLAHVTTDSHGDVTVDVQSKAGKRTFVIYFVAPGTSLKGKTLTGTVK